MSTPRDFYTKNTCTVSITNHACLIKGVVCICERKEECPGFKVHHSLINSWRIGHIC